MKQVTAAAVLLLALSVGGLWAEEGMTSEGVIYDTIVQESAFSYVVGFRGSAQFQRIEFEVHDGIDPSTYVGEYDSYGLGLFYRAEWENFIFGVAPVLYFQALHRAADGDGRFWERVMGHTRQNLFGVEFQVLGRLPLAKDTFQCALYGGLESSVGADQGLNSLLGADFGVKVTDHHALVLGASVQFPLVPFEQALGIEHLIKNQLQKGVSWDARGPGFKVQVCLGVRTLIIENVYYYQGQEVGRGR